jgi:hypothetical protein
MTKSTPMELYVWQRGLAMSKLINNFVDSLITNFGTYSEDSYELDFDSVDESDRAEFASLLLQETDREDLTCITENDLKDDIAIAIMKSLSRGASANYDLAETINTSIVKHFEPKMKELIADRLPCVSYDFHSSIGLSKYQDRHTGEFHLGSF